MISNFVVTPYVGVGPIKFGMSRVQIQHILGSPDMSKKSKMSQRVTDYWKSEDITVIFSSQEGVVQEISFGFLQSEAEIEGYKIFQHKGHQTYQDLCLKDGDPRTDVGFTVLFNLGITLDGFLVTDQEQRVVTAFSPGIWDKEDKSLRPVGIGLK